MRLCVPEPLYYLVRLSAVDPRDIQALGADEFPALLQNCWEDGKRHRMEGNARMAYICWMTFFHILHYIQAFRKEVIKKLVWTPRIKRMLKGRIQEVSAVSAHIIAQSGKTGRRSRQRQ